MVMFYLVLFAVFMTHIAVNELDNCNVAYEHTSPITHRNSIVGNITIQCTVQCSATSPNWHVNQMGERESTTATTWNI